MSLSALSRRITSPVARFFSGDGSPIDLAIFRIVLFGVLVYYGAARWNYVWFAGLPQELRIPPLLTGWVWAALPVTLSTVKAAQVVFVAACALACVGAWTRISSVAATVLGFYVLGIPQLFGKIDHYNHLWWFSAILAASRCGDALSVDQWRRRSPQFPRSRAHAYGLPLRFVWALVGLVYLFPGFAKLGVASDWVSAENMRNQLHAKWLELTLETGSDWLPPFRLDEHPALLTLAGAATVLFETTFLAILLFVRRARWYLVPAGLAFHTMTRLMMGISFWELQVCYVAFVDWSRLWPTRELKPAAFPSSRLLPIVGTALIVTNYLAGALAVNSWPITVYPTFAYLTGPTAATIEIAVTTADGTTRPLDAAIYSRLSEELGSARFFRLLTRVANGNQRLAAGLAKLVMQADTTARAVTLRRIDREVRPDRWAITSTAPR